MTDPLIVNAIINELLDTAIADAIMAESFTTLDALQTEPATVTAAPVPETIPPSLEALTSFKWDNKAAAQKARFDACEAAGFAATEADGSLRLEDSGDSRAML
ncbi:Uu.00g024690.m01.CDS01 [Anthostomella pinea]|uniref:Uu.00g024690.m01.CDS01 n=1 Tax=Anthostomella pinea TaxID=933095 RepID=A0AAI8V879_9PEZI|nr:Uu.00g024690.m01.CDS01 [Anthostomella pinea]